MPVLNVSSRVTWLQLDDKPLLLCCATGRHPMWCFLAKVFSCMAGRSRTKAYGRHYAAWPSNSWRPWLHAVGKEPMAHLYYQGALTERITEKTFRKERRRLQVKHFWMEVKLNWNVFSDRMYTETPNGKSREQLCELLFNRAARAAKKIPMKRKHTVDLPTEKSRHGGSNAESGCCLQMPMCATGPGHWRLGQGRGCSCWGWCIYGILRKAVANKRGHLPAQATTTLARSFHWPVCVFFLNPCRARHDSSDGHHWPVCVKIYKSFYVRILEFLKPQNNKRQNTTDTPKANPQANHWFQNPFEFRKLLLPHTKPRNVSCLCYVLFTCWHLCSLNRKSNRSTKSCLFSGQMNSNLNNHSKTSLLTSNSHVATRTESKPTLLSSLCHPNCWDQAKTHQIQMLSIQIKAPRIQSHKYIVVASQKHYRTMQK